MTVSKKDRTIEVYKECGAYMRLVTTLCTYMYTKLNSIMPKKELAKLHRALEVIQQTRSDIEDRMFEEFRPLDREYIDVFYGALDDAPHTEIDAEVIDKALEITKRLFGENYDRKTNY